MQRTQKAAPLIFAVLTATAMYRAEETGRSSNNQGGRGKVAPPVQVGHGAGWVPSGLRGVTELRWKPRRRSERPSQAGGRSDPTFVVIRHVGARWRSEQAVQAVPLLTGGPRPRGTHLLRLAA